MATGQRIRTARIFGFGRSHDGSRLPAHNPTRGRRGPTGCHWTKTWRRWKIEPSVPHHRRENIAGLIPCTRRRNDEAPHPFIDGEDMAFQGSPGGGSQSAAPKFLSHHGTQIFERRAGAMKLLQRLVSGGIAESADEKLRVKSVFRGPLHRCGTCTADLSDPSHWRRPAKRSGHRAWPLCRGSAPAGIRRDPGRARLSRWRSKHPAPAAPSGVLTRVSGMCAALAVRARRSPGEFWMP
jgi:hypothetical protein